MKLFSDHMPASDEPLPNSLLLRVGWVEGLAMTAACFLFTLVALYLIVAGKGVLAFFALFVFAPGLLLGWRQLRTGGYFIVLNDKGIIRSDYGQLDKWEWEQLDRCVAGTRRGVEGVWCRISGGELSDEVLIEPGGRDVGELAGVINRFQNRARLREPRPV